GRDSAAEGHCQDAGIVAGNRQSSVERRHGAARTSGLVHRGRVLRHRDAQTRRQTVFPRRRRRSGGVCLMAFHFVDRIYEYEPYKRIRGLKNVTRNENFFYWLPDGRRVLSPAVITEALCQLGGWLKIVSTDFQRRPVLLADEKTDYLGMVEAGDQIDLEVEVLDFGDDVVVTRGSASVQGEEVLVGHCFRGY